jgi:predicted RNase H-like nuclease (RuvC/YqgF family)
MIGSMSVGAEGPSRAELPREWERLERVAEAAAAEVVFWRRRTAEAEEEVGRLRRSLEDLAVDGNEAGDERREIVRLRAENTALQSRMLQARKRVGALLKRLSALELDP